MGGTARGIQTRRCVDHFHLVFCQDWAANLKSLPTSRVLRRITSHLLVNTFWSAIVTAYYIHFAPPEWDVSPMPHSLMASALGLLLVFRTNAVSRMH